MTLVAMVGASAIWNFTMSVTGQPFRLSSHVIRDHLLTVFSEPSTPSHGIAGRITGWMEALMENAPHTFRSFVAEERVTALHTRYKEQIREKRERAILRSLP